MSIFAFTTALLVYMLVVYAIGAVAQRRVTTVDDYVLAGRKLPVSLTTITMIATWFGAESLLTTADEVAQRGVRGGLMDPIGIAICLVITGLFIAGPMWRMQVLTIPDFFRIRYGKLAEVLTSIVLVPSYFGWVAAQYVALATILSQIYGLPVSAWICIVAVLGIGYALMGGMWSITLTDSLQLALIALGLVILGVEVLAELGQGSLTAGLTRIRGETPDAFWRLADPPTYRADMLSAISILVISALGNQPVQDLMQRVFSARSPSTASAACFLSAVGYMAMGLLPMGVGMSAGLLLDQVPEEGVLTVVAFRFLSPALLIIFLLAIVSAVLSTIVSAVMAPAAVLAHNLVEPAIASRWGKVSGDRALSLQRWSMVCVSAASVVLALSGRSAFELVQDAYSMSLVGMFVPFVIGIYIHPVPGLAANASIVIGITSWLTHIFLDWEFFAHPYLSHRMAIPHELIDTLLSAIAFAICWWIAKKPVDRPMATA